MAHRLKAQDRLARDQPRLGEVECGLEGAARALFDPRETPPAPGQGALAIETRIADAGADWARALNDGPASLATAAVAVGGPILFLAGHALFKHAVSGWVLTSHLAGIAALGLLLPVGMVVSPLLVGAAATLVVVAVAAWDARLALVLK